MARCAAHDIWEAVAGRGWRYLLIETAHGVGHFARQSLCQVRPEGESYDLAAGFFDHRKIAALASAAAKRWL
jgi:hypothetical protein